jgi:hypothetical protein
MGAVKMNITLPAKIASTLKAKVKPRERSAVIAKALALYFKNANQKTIMQDLIQAYKTSARLTGEDKEWVDADLIGNPNDAD